MESARIEKIIQQQKEYFDQHKTKSYHNRIETLKKLGEVIVDYESQLVKAMQADMAKPEIEAAGGEIWFVLDEIRHAIRHLKRWMKPSKKRTPLLHFRSSSVIYSEP
ncbi:MAG TPA: aldehyde dehydrogenase family protein, partial [Anaerolineaceae bacterium]|nr:aldehyde dehydrogenase family protein [Anaerolineaceae bacterium]